MNSVHELIEQLRKSDYVREKRFGDISSFNFTRSAFYEGRWNAVTTKARGLFINTRTEKIVARGYDKFFNVDENSQTTMDAIRQKIRFPIKVYKKENGFLGLISWDHEKDDFFFATKSMMEGPYVDTLKHLFFTTGINTEEVKAFLREDDSTMIVEVIDPVFDPHIIEYETAHLVLLDIVANALSTAYMPYWRLTIQASNFHMEIKKLQSTLMEFPSLEIIKLLCNKPYFVDESGKPFEGYVFRDARNFMFKMKTAYYLKWKRYRRYADMLFNGKQPQVKGDLFLAWVEKNKDKLSCKSIIEMRNLYEADSTEL